MIMATPAPIPYYPGTKPVPPTADAPMQLLSPWSAMYGARLLGCRLPTSDEWKAAYEKYEAHSLKQKDAWNLRGAAWLAQQNYSKTMNGNGMPYPDQGVFLPVALAYGDASVTADSAKPWHYEDLAKIAPNRLTSNSGIYAGGAIWFRNVGSQPDAGPDDMHDLVGNVAEYTFDAPGAIAVIKDNAASVDDVNKTLAANDKSVFVIGGSSLSAPEIPFNQEQAVPLTPPQADNGFCDVGFRLAYTAPIDSIVDVLGAVYKEPPYILPPIH
jgi:hypothetical protein